VGAWLQVVGTNSTASGSGNRKNEVGSELARHVTAVVTMKQEEDDHGSLWEDNEHMTRMHSAAHWEDQVDGAPTELPQIGRAIQEDEKMRQREEELQKAFSYGY
jgi:hypothetical protein